MTTNTSRLLLPYPDPGDPIASGDDTIKALALRLNRVLQAYRLDVTAAVSTTAATRVLTFSEAFDDVPAVLCTVEANTTHWAVASAVTATQAQINVGRYNGASFTGTIKVNVFAMRAVQL